MRKNYNKPLEVEESKNLTKYLDDLVLYKKVICFSHIPNETSIKNMAYLMKIKAMGKRKGVPDYIVLLENKILFIELKRQKDNEGYCPSSISTEQQQWIDNLNKINNNSVLARVCYGADEALSFIKNNIK